MSVTIGGDLNSSEEQAFLSTTGVVPSKQTERFTIPDLTVPVAYIAKGGEVTYTIRYGRVARRGYEWRESGKLAIPVPSKSVGVGVLSELLFVRVGEPVVEQLKRTKR